MPASSSNDQIKVTKGGRVLRKNADVMVRSGEFTQIKNMAKRNSKKPMAQTMAKFKPASSLAGGFNLIAETAHLDEEGQSSSLMSTNRRAYESYTNDPLLIKNKYPEQTKKTLDGQSSDIVNSSSD